MDLKQYEKQVEYYEYFEHQKENYIDLSLNEDDPNNSVVKLAKILFDKPAQNLREDLVGIFIDDNMENADIFCMLVEMVLYGLNILSRGDYTIFDLSEPDDDIIFTIKSYLNSMGFDMRIDQDFVDDIDNTTCLYRDRKDYYCEIVNKPPKYLCPSQDWYVLNYRMILNKKFNFFTTTPLDVFRLFFISKENKIFVLSFSVKK